MGGRNLDQFRSKQKANQQDKPKDLKGAMPKSNITTDNNKNS